MTISMLFSHAMWQCSSKSRGGGYCASHTRTRIRGSHFSLTQGRAAYTRAGAYHNKDRNKRGKSSK